MTLSRYLAEVSHREHLMWVEHYNRHLTDRTTEHAYLAAIAREVYLSDKKHEVRKRVGLDPFYLKFGEAEYRRVDKPKNITPEQIALTTSYAKSVWAVRLGRFPGSEKVVTKG